MSAVLDVSAHTPDETAAITEPVPTLTCSTLFELITALQDAAEPDDDTTVVAAVVDLFQTGRIRLLGGAVTQH